MDIDVFRKKEFKFIYNIYMYFWNIDIYYICRYIYINKFMELKEDTWNILRRL